MLSRETIERYFHALATRDGAGAAQLFADTGVIDDFRGRHHAGRPAIEAFLSNVPALALDFVSPILVEAPRVTVYGRITYSPTDQVLIRWVFTADGDLIGHLCNSRIEHVPPDRQLPAWRG